MLKIENLSCGYNSKEVLKGINVTINTGEVVGIVGPNGSGKTTFLRALTRVIEPYKGKVLFDNINIRDFKHKDIATKIAVVLQESEPVNISVEESTLLGRIPYHKGLQFFETKKDEETAYKYMMLTDIHSLKDELLSRISGGEKQLALIARALTQEPKLILLDEPTTFLDITHQVRILNLIKKLNKSLGLTVVMVLHDLNMASEYCDRLLLFNEGEIYKDGAPKDVLTYKNIEDVYKTVVVVNNNPVSGKPHILVVSESNEGTCP